MTALECGCHWAAEGAAKLYDALNALSEAREGRCAGHNAAFAGDVASEVGGILRPIVEQLVEQLVEQVRGLDDGHGDDVGSFKNVQRVSEKLTRGLRDFNGNTVGSVELISTWKEDE